MAKPKNPPKKNPPKKNVKTRFVDGKLEPFPKRGKPKQNIRKAADSGPAPSNVKSCAKTLAEYKYKKDIDYKKYLKEKGKARVAKEKAEKAKKKAQEKKAEKAKEAPTRNQILKIPKQKNSVQKKKESRQSRVNENIRAGRNMFD